MTAVELALTMVKISIVLGFALNFGGLATWADRRQSAMIQHRVGPNRAVVYLPSFVIRIILFAPALLFGAVSALAFTNPHHVRDALEKMTTATQLSVMVIWFNLMILTAFVRKSGAVNKFEETLTDVAPRHIFFVGLAAHAALFLAVRMMPEVVLMNGVRPAGVALGAILCACAFYAASRVPAGKIGIRALGTLHAAADAVKLIFKEDFIPKKADRLLHGLAPIIALFPALVTFAVIPFGDTLCFEDVNHNGLFEFSDLPNVVQAMGRDGVCPGHGVPLQVIDMNVGILYVFAIGSTGVIGAALAGWASDNKFSLLGGLRAASQMVSYEVAMGLSLVGVFIIFGTVRLTPMVQWQSVYAWGIFVQPIAFFMFITCLAAETKRVPFDQPEGESEIVAGYFLEYSGMKFGMFMTGEYIEVITSSALLVTVFFGGYSMPFLYADGITVSFGSSVLYEYGMNHVAVTVLQALAFFGKVLFVAFIQIFFRWTLPRFRYDQLMKLGWTKLLPLAIANLVVTAVVWLAIDSAPAGVGEVLRFIGDLTKAFVALLMLGGFVAFIAGLLAPVERKRFLQSTSLRFSEAAGGTKASPMQA